MVGPLNILLVLQVLAYNCFAENELGLLTPEKTMQVATAYDRVMVSIVIDFSQVNKSEILSVYNGITEIKTAWYQKDWWDEFQGKDNLNQGEIYTQRMAALWTQAETFRTHGKEKLHNHDCEIKIELTTSDIFLEYDLLSKKYTAIKELTKNDIQTKTKVYSILDFIHQYLTSTAEWLHITENHVTHLEQLKDGVLPDDFMAKFASLKCLTPEESEYVKVLDCFVEPQRYRCNVDVGVPKNTKTITKLYPVNFNGIELYIPNDHMYYTEENKNTVNLFNCTSHMAWSSAEKPLCVEVPPTQCEKALGTNDITDIINECHFQHLTPEPVVRVIEDGIMILSKDTVVTDGIKIITKTPPYILYTNNNVSIQLPDDTVLYIHAGNKVDNPKMVTSQISKMELVNLSIQTWWDCFWREFNILDYMEYLALVLSGITAPCALFSCLMKRKRGRKRTAPKPLRKKETASDRRAKRKENNRLLERAQI